MEDAAKSGLAEEARKLLRDLLEQEEVSHRELERRTGVSKRTIARILAGGYVPSLDTYDKILAGLGYSVRLDITSF